jgi:rubrerythrin
MRHMTGRTGAQTTRQADDPTRWQCLTCEYVVESVTLPFSCPRCGASRVKFVEMKAGAAPAEAEE